MQLWMINNCFVFKLKNFQATSYRLWSLGCLFNAGVVTNNVMKTVSSSSYVCTRTCARMSVCVCVCALVKACACTFYLKVELDSGKQPKLWNIYSYSFFSSVIRLDRSPLYSPPCPVSTQALKIFHEFFSEQYSLWWSLSLLNSHFTNYALWHLPKES